MKRKLREAIRERRIQSEIRYHTVSFKETIKKKSIIKDFTSLTQKAKKSIYLKSYQLRESSLKKSMHKRINNRRHAMRLAFGLALRNVTRSRYRSFLLILGITLTIALETGIVVSIDTLYDNFILDHRNRNYTDITVNPKSWTDLPDLKALAKRIKGISGVSKASPVYYTTDNEFAGHQISQNIILYGIEAGSHPDFSKLNVTEGRRRVSGNTVMISQSLKFGSGVEVGETVDTPSGYGLQTRSITIGGIISDDSIFGNKFGYLFILVDIETLYETVLEEYRATYLKTEIDISVSNLLNIKSTGENIKDELGLNYFVFVEKDISEIEATGIKAYQTAMNLVIISSFVVEFLFITNILAIAIRDRSRETGVLRAVGTSYKQLIETIIIEILIYSVIGSIIGIVLGIGSSFILVSIIDDFYSGLTIHSLSLHNSSLSAAFFSGIVVALISGLYPIFLSLKMPIVQNIHSRMRSSKSSYTLTSFWKYTITSGALLAITGFILQYFVGPSRFLNFEILSFHFFVIILIFIGTLLLEVGILVFLPSVALKVLFWFGIISRTISMRNIGREFQKSLFTIMTSALALAFIIVVGLVSAAVIKAVPVYFESQWGSIDLVLEASDTELVPINFSNNLDSRTDVVTSSYIQEVRTKLNEIDGYVFGVDPLRYAHFSEPVFDSLEPGTPSYLYLDQTETNHSISGTKCLISRFLYQRLDISLGSNISVATTDNSTIDITIAAVIKTNAFLGDGEYIYIASERFQEFYNTSLAKYFICDVVGERETAQKSFEIAYLDQFKDVIGVDFFTRAIEKSLKFQSAIFQVLFVESFILAAIAQFVCILVSTLHMEREMGVMRAIGLHKKDVFEIFMSEATALGLAALIIGLIDGLLGSLLLSWYIQRSLPIEFVFPIERIVFWLIFSFVITISSTFLPSYRSSKKSVVATISGRPFSKDYVMVEPLKFSYDQKNLSLTPTSPPPLPSLISEPNYLKQESKFSQIHLTEFDYDGTYPLFVKSIKFIINRKIQVLTSFLILLAIITFNYIIDAYIIIRGIIGFDFALRMIFFFGILSDNFTNTDEEIFHQFSFINPFLLFIGLALVGPISYYLYYERPSNNLFIESIKSFIIGIVFIIGAILISNILIFSSIMLINLFLGENAYSILVSAYIIVLDLIFSAIIVLVLYQKTWEFLVFSGLNPDIPIVMKIKYLVKNSSKSQVGFILLLLIHFSLQAILFLIINLSRNIFDQEYTIIREVDPISFLLLSGFEIGFFLFLIIYQSVQFKPLKEPVIQESPSILNKTQEIEKLKKDVSFIAENLLQKNQKGINIKTSGYSIFSESIEGNLILFFQENPNNMPVAMNYARDWPQPKTRITKFSKIEIKIPTLEQMKIFLGITKDLITPST